MNGAIKNRLTTMMELFNNLRKKLSNVKLKNTILWAFIIILYSIPIIFGYYYVVRYSVNVPYWDQWDTVVVWTINWYEGKFGFSDLFGLYNDSRPTFPIIFILLTSLLTSLNIKTLYIAGYTIYVVCFVVLFYFIKSDIRLDKITLFLLVPVLYYAFNPYYLTRFIANIGAFVAPFIIFSALITTHLLYMSKNSYIYYFSAIGMGIVCSFSGAPGLSIWFAGFIQLIIQKMHRKWEKTMIWIITTIFVFCTYFVLLGYRVDGSLHSMRAYNSFILTALCYPLHKFLCFMGTVGAEVIHEKQTALFFGLMILIVFVLIIYVNRKSLELDRYSKWYGLLAFGALMSLELALTRSGSILYGSPDNIFFVPHKRHSLYIFLPIICIYLLGIGYVKDSSKKNIDLSDSQRIFENRKSINVFLVGIIFTLLLCSVILHFFPGLNLGENIYKDMIERKYILKTYETQLDENLKKLHPNPDIVRKRASILEKYNLSIFAHPNPDIVRKRENTHHLYEPTATKILSQQQFIMGTAEINNEVKFILYEHPILNDRTILAFENITILPHAKLKFSIALAPTVWDPNKGDGVTFEIFIKYNSKEEKVFSKYIDPKHNPEERKWNDFEVDLSKYADKNVTIIFSTLPGPNNDSRWDWAWWGEPRIEVIE